MSNRGKRVNIQEPHSRVSFMKTASFGGLANLPVKRKGTVDVDKL
jgi:hypothetical protein